MAPTAWPALFAGPSATVRTANFSANRATRLSRITGLKDAHEVLIRKSFAIYFAEVLVTNTAYGTDSYAFHLFVPGQWRTRTLYLSIEAYVSAGTGAWIVVDVDNADAVISAAEITVSNTTPYAKSGPSVIAIPAGWSDDAIRHLAIQGKKVTSGTLYLRNLSVIESYVSNV